MTPEWANRLMDLLDDLVSSAPRLASRIELEGLCRDLTNDERRLIVASLRYLAQMHVEANKGILP